MLYDKIITLFNYHEQTALWYPSIINGVDLIEITADSNSAAGDKNADAVEILINCNADKRIMTVAGYKGYLAPNTYQKCDSPEDFITFSPKQDFIYCGEWPDVTPVSDDEDFDSGFYQRVNTDYDGIYKINSAVFYSLLPHFEIGGK